MWQGILQPYVKDGRLIALGIIQEQHPDRAKLYRQWKQFDWPVLVDSLNLYDVSAVPIPVAIDEEGIVCQARSRPGSYIHQFVKRTKKVDRRRSLAPSATKPNMDRLLAAAQSAGTAKAWRELGDAFFHIPGEVGLDQAVDAYEKVIEIDAGDGRSHFRFGVALRRRSESSFRRIGDAQSAVDHWGRALDINSNQYIWRRRIQQYGPRLDKPYNFYSWVDQARKEIIARGERPIRLHVEPTGSEVAPPTKPASSREKSTHPHRDLDGRVTRDQKQLVYIESVVTPARVRPGSRLWHLYHRCAGLLSAHGYVYETVRLF